VFRTSRYGFTSRVYNNILETIGNTPVVKLQKIAPKNVDVYVKCEFFNPLSSVKDRLAIGIIEDAEKKGHLKAGQTVVEATSGNTGIALAMVCAFKGYPFVATMAETFSVERRKIMRALGAQVILTPASGGGYGMVKKAEELAKAHGWFLTRQFENEANPEYHANTTGPEILSAFVGRNLDYWVTGYGTGGTFAGAGRVLKSARPDIKIILSEPSNAPLVTSGVAQEREKDGSPASGHPKFTSHPIQGWTPNFIPLVTQKGLDDSVADEVITIGHEEAMKTALLLASSEGIFAGISGGATLATALKVAESAKDGSGILAMLPDTMERYLTTPLFQSIVSDMNDAEQKIAESTPNYILPKQN